MIATSSVVDRDLEVVVLFGGSKMEGEINDLFYIKLSDLS